MKQMKRELENKLNELGIDSVRIGREVLFDLDGKPIEAKVKRSFSPVVNTPEVLSLQSLVTTPTFSILLVRS